MALEGSAMFALLGLLVLLVAAGVAVVFSLKKGEQVQAVTDAPAARQVNFIILF